ncbi:MAG: TonB-dependent receptor [Undibacterium sp.]|nr:TonB-dependent receptor [Opitutaceae bacterium]
MSPRTYLPPRLTVAFAALALATAASAQTVTPVAKDEAVSLEAFVTIGSRFNQRTATESAVPIDVITEREIRQGGYTETAKILQAQIPSFNNPHPTTPDGNTHIRSVTLRGLSPHQTLVLVNGKRRHTSAWVNTGGTIGRGAVSTDLNAIPSTALGRIEVLRDGASAQYGSDAIAGVINLVLREDLGFGASGTYGATKESGGEVWEASVESGFKLGDGGYFHSTLYHRDRNATNSALPDTRQFYFGTNATTGAVTANNAAFASGTTNPPANTLLDPREASVNRNVWRYGDGDLVENTFFFNAGVPLQPKKALEFYAFGGIGRSEAVSNASFRRPADNNNVRALYPNGFLPFVDTDSTNLSLAAGLRGKASTWDWDLSQEIGNNKLKYFTHNTLNASLGTASPTRFYNGRLEFTQAVTNLDLKTSLDGGLPAPVKVATGAEFRADSYKIGSGGPDSSRGGGVAVLDGPSIGAVATVGAQGFGGIGPRDAQDVDRHSYAFYVDAENDLTKTLRVSAAARFEDYSDFGTTFNGKGAARLALLGGLAARASVSTGFHAPALQQQSFGSTSSRTDANTNTIILSRVFPVGDPAARALGATKLDAEKSINWTGGFAYENGGLAATADFYQIEINDRIFLSSQFTGTAVLNYLTAQGIAGVEGARFFTNAADTKTRGFDLTLRDRFSLGPLGKLTVTAGYNYNTTTLTRVRSTPASVTALGITTPLFDITERIRATRGQPRTNAQLALAWDYQRFSFLARGVRYGDYEAVALTNLSAAQVALFSAGSNFRTLPTETIGAAAGNADVIGKFDARILTDLDFAYRLNDRFTLSVGANNAFNIHPPEVIRSNPQRLGADAGGVFRYSEFSPFSYSGAFYYTRLTVKF